MERLHRDIDLAETEESQEQKKILAYMALAAAEFAIDFELIPTNEWSELLDRIFPLL
jgi:hypothetical protein